MCECANAARPRVCITRRRRHFISEKENERRPRVAQLAVGRTFFSFVISKAVFGFSSSERAAGATTTRARCTTAARLTTMPSTWTRGMFDKPRRPRKEFTQEAIPGLLKDVVVTHILGAIDDPLHLAQLRAVSPSVRDAVAATGRLVKEFSNKEAAELGYLSTLKSKRRRGLVKSCKDLCKAAAKGGQLETLKWLRLIGCKWNEARDPWKDAGVCMLAARGGHLEMLKWARATGAPYDEYMSAYVGMGGHSTCWSG